MNPASSGANDQAPPLEARLDLGRRGRLGMVEAVWGEPFATFDAQWRAWVKALPEEKAEIERFTTAEVKLLASTKFPGGIYALAFSPDGSHLAAAGEDGHVRLITTTDGTVAKDFIPVPLARTKLTQRE